MRYTAPKNRQSSSDPIENPILYNLIREHLDDSIDLYQKLLSMNVAKETARMVLPLSTGTTMYMNGTLRSWIHYINLRTSEDTQKEHREIALAIKDLLKENFPTTYEALYGEKA
jgi:thymidylate synthase (FAD)